MSRRLALLASCALLVSCAQQGGPRCETACADFVFANGRVYTVDDAQPWAEALAVRANRIAYVGSTAEACRLVGSATRVINLRGRLMLPGMIDTHMHPGVAGLAVALGVNLVEAQTEAEYVAAVRRYAESNPNAPVIGGFGFVPQVFGPGGPTKAALDSAVSDRPVFIISGHGHSAWANSKALEVLGITKDTPDPHPGAHFYRRHQTGEPTGHLVEGAAFWSHLPALDIGTPDQFVAGYPTVLSLLPQVGITSLFDAGTPAVQEGAFNALKQLESAGDLPLRYFASFYAIDEADAAVAVDTLKRFRRDYTTELLRPSAIKISNDGQSPDFRTPHLQFDGRQLAPIFTSIAAAGENVMIHATNDRTVKETLDGIEAAKRAHPHSESRFIITHGDVMSVRDFERYVSLDVVASMQPMVAQVGFFGNQQVPKDRLVLPLRSLRERGVVVSASSDFPACGAPIWGCTPFHGIEVGVQRGVGPASVMDQPLAPDDERMSVAEAVRAYTLGSAYQVGMEGELGSLEKGKLADLIVVDQNLLEVDTYRIHETKVLMTMVNGRVVHGGL